MTSRDDFPGEMDRFPFDDSDADAVFGATSGSDSVPEDLRDIADLVRAARRAGSEDELVGSNMIVAQIAAAVGEHAASPRGDAHERTRVLSKFRTMKLTAAAAAALMLGATAAAAGTGALPSPMQSSVAKALSGVGINVSSHRHARLVVKPAETTAAIAHHHRRSVGAKHVGTEHAPVAFGVVASVNDAGDASACGVLGAPGTFTLNGWKGKTFTVNVDTSTAYLDKGVTDASFANVCVGSLVLAKGTIADTTVTATDVFIVPMKHEHEDHHGAFGTVASVNGVSDANTCGALDGTGTFTLTAWKDKTFTVTVDSSTTFRAHGVTAASFADVCVGAKVGVKGDVTDTTITATGVFVLPAHMHKDHHDGDSDHDGTHHSKGNGANGFGFVHDPKSADAHRQGHSPSGHTTMTATGSSASGSGFGH